MGRWADYLVSAVRYGPDRRIAEAVQHEDGDEIGGGVRVGRDVIAGNLRRGLRYSTIFGAGSSWRIGDTIRLVRAGGGHSIRTDANRVELDSLGPIPEPGPSSRAA